MPHIQKLIHEMRDRDAETDRAAVHDRLDRLLDSPEVRHGIDPGIGATRTLGWAGHACVQRCARPDQAPLYRIWLHGRQFYHSDLIHGLDVSSVLEMMRAVEAGVSRTPHPPAWAR